MALLQSVRGMHDWLPHPKKHYDYVVEKALSVTKHYGFSPVATPLVEDKEVFVRTAGQGSDIVQKEMFEVAAREEGARPLVLRPEGTAALGRMVLQHNLWSPNTCLRYSYHGPMLRHERPQKGRLRQHHQFGIEALGVQDPWIDVEVLACAYTILRELGMEKSVTFTINTLGDTASREKYVQCLYNYLVPLKEGLSLESQGRLVSNPLRILDSKDKRDQAILQGAPRLRDSLSIKAGNFFEKVLKGIESLAIPYTVAEHLVRGLDYYTHTVFECTATSGLGSQSTLLAGGRYDGLLESLGGPSCPGIGWALGIERLLLLEPFIPLEKPALAVACENSFSLSHGLLLCETIRKHQREVLLFCGEKWRTLMKQLDKAGVVYAILQGEREIAEGVLKLKTMQDGEEKIFSQENLLDLLEYTLR